MCTGMEFMATWNLRWLHFETGSWQMYLLKMRPYWISVGPDMWAAILRRRENRGTNRHTGRIPCDDKGRNWSDTSICQGTPRSDSSHLKLGRDKERSSLTMFKENRVLLALDFGPLASRTATTKNFCWFKLLSLVICYRSPKKLTQQCINIIIYFIF